MPSTVCGYRYPSLRGQSDRYSKRQITNNKCSLHPQCTVDCLSVSSYVQWNCLARLSLSNMVLKMNLVMTQSTENFCVSEDYSDQTESCNYVLIPCGYKQIPNNSRCTNDEQNSKTYHSYTRSSQSYNLSVSEPQQQGEKSVHAYCRQC